MADVRGVPAGSGREGDDSHTDRIEPRGGGSGEGWTGGACRTGVRKLGASNLGRLGVRRLRAIWGEYSNSSSLFGAENSLSLVSSLSDIIPTVTLEHSGRITTHLPSRAEIQRIQAG